MGIADPLIAEVNFGGNRQDSGNAHPARAYSVRGSRASTGIGMSQRRHLIPFLEGLDSAVVGCVGDIMLDRFVYGAVNRISPRGYRSRCWGISGPTSLLNNRCSAAWQKA